MTRITTASGTAAATHLGPSQKIDEVGMGSHHDHKPNRRGSNKSSKNHSGDSHLPEAAASSGKNKTKTKSKLKPKRRGLLKAANCSNKPKQELNSKRASKPAEVAGPSNLSTVGKATRRRRKAKSSTTPEKQTSPGETTPSSPAPSPSRSPSLLRPSLKPSALNLLQRSKSVPAKIPQSQNQRNKLLPFGAMGFPTQNLHPFQHNPNPHLHQYARSSNQSVQQHQQHIHSPQLQFSPREFHQQHSQRLTRTVDAIPRPSLVRASSERRHQTICLPNLKPSPVCDVSVVSSLPEGSIEPVSHNIATTVEERARQLRELEAPFVPPAEIVFRIQPVAIPSPPSLSPIPPPIVQRQPIPDWLSDVANNENVKPRGVFDAGEELNTDKTRVHPFQERRTEDGGVPFVAPSPVSSPPPSRARGRIKRIWRQPQQPQPQQLSPTQVHDHPDINSNINGGPHHQRNSSMNNVEKMLNELVLQETSETEDGSSDDNSVASIMPIHKKSHRRTPSASTAFKLLTLSSPRKNTLRNESGCLA